MLMKVQNFLNPKLKNFKSKNLQYAILNLNDQLS